ncbi:hypothetical protein HAX54_022181 [Datura stramonium]|uniref:Uncharacterized protein n=1 Tax=Datura stramonium TaxID=4076 RepID=A0ABS8UU38_DATST|nr:hypothetical protein [Datura stramonium]
MVLYKNTKARVKNASPSFLWQQHGAQVASEVELLPRAVPLRRKNSRCVEIATSVKLRLLRGLNSIRASLVGHITNILSWELLSLLRLQIVPEIYIGLGQGYNGPCSPSRSAAVALDGLSPRGGDASLVDPNPSPEGEHRTSGPFPLHLS